MNMRQRQVAFNQSTKDQWNTFAEHRCRVQQLIQDSGEMREHARLCVLGAGNCNDLELQQLKARFREIHLVDLDAGAVEAGLKRQLHSDRTGVKVHAPCDLTGCIDLWPNDSSNLSSATASEIKRILDTHQPSISMHGPFDVVVSAGLLTQLLTASLLQPWSQEEQWRWASQLRRQHLKLIMDLLSPHGTGIFITDTVSSVTAPELLDNPSHDWLAALNHFIEHKNFFTGTNPAAIHAEWTQLALNHGFNVSFEPIYPWVWKQSSVKAYLVWGLQIKRTT